MKYLLSIAGCLSLALLTACSTTNSNSKSYKLKEYKVITGFDVPESALHIPNSKLVYVSNMETSTEGFWEDDGKAFITLMTTDGKIIKKRWLDSTKKSPLNSLKGLAVLNGKLYFADNKQLKRCDLKDPSKVEAFELPNAQKLNDLASDGKSILVADTGQGAIYRFTEDGKHTMIKSPKGVNGVTYRFGKYYAVSFAEHDVYELDPTGKNEPLAFGLADKFTNLDGIEVLNDKSFIISDVRGHAIFHLTADRKTVTKLASLDWAADIGIDRKNKLIFAPALKSKKVVIYKLK